MRLVFMGSPVFSVPCLRALHACGHDICAVYSQPPRPSGRGKKLQKTAVHEAAIELGLSCHVPFDFSNPSEREKLAKLNAEIAVVVAYGIILPKSVLSCFARGGINLHASLLPRWRGAAPIQRAIMAGDKMSGVCVMQMEESLDKGAVFARQETAIGYAENAGDLAQRLSVMGADLMVRALDDLDNLTPHPQQEHEATYASKINKSEARLDWMRPAAELDRQIRALSPQIGAWFEANDLRYKILEGEVVHRSARAGKVLSGLTIACAQGGIKVTTIQPQGKKPMTAKAFLNGYSLPIFVT